jgi:Mrp family chromosome partitioning ATPase
METGAGNKEKGRDQLTENNTAQTKDGLWDVGGKFPAGEDNKIKFAVAVASGKGGVGKSTVSSLVAIGLQQEGAKVGIMDADFTGASIPRLFGLKGMAEGSKKGILPRESKLGIKIMSMNLLLVDEEQPVIWRGPLLTTAVRQFWQDVYWGELDYLIIDLPPGTGDTSLTVMKHLPIAGIVMVSAPQDLAVLVVKRAIRMANDLDVSLLGLVENMSYIECPQCGEKISVFGPSQAEEIVAKTGVPLLGTLPIDPQLASLCNEGRIEDWDHSLPAALARFITGRLSVAQEGS